MSFIQRLVQPATRYTHWLHTQWPAGTVEKMPLANPDGSTAVQGLYIVGDLTGVPLLKFSADTGAKAVETICNDIKFQNRSTSGDDVYDVLIVGGGVSGFAAAIEAKKRGLRFELIEASEPFSTIVNFPKAKPIYTYPTEMTPAGSLQFHKKSSVKEGLLVDLDEQVKQAGIKPIIARVPQIDRQGSLLNITIAPPANTPANTSSNASKTLKAHRVIVAIGRSGNYRKLNIPGESLGKVANRLFDPKAFNQQKLLVVGGGDSALEAAIALAKCGNQVTLSYRKPEFSRPKPDNIQAINALSKKALESSTDNPKSLQAGSINLMLASHPKAITEKNVVIADANGVDQTLDNDAVFTLIGREAPLDFFRRSGVPIRGEWRKSTWVRFVLFFLFCIWLYHWKSYKIPSFGIDPSKLWEWIATLNSSFSQWAKEPSSFFYTLKQSASSRSFYYTLAYCTCVTVFGIRRIRRRKTPYVTWQTCTLIMIQILPLFLLPELILPYLGRNGYFDTGIGRTLADAFFPVYDPANLAERAYWRSYGFILAWPLMVYNWFTAQPLWGWLILGVIQTFVIIPVLIYRFGKGAYCGWLCSCGALAETMGDTHRHKMPHGPKWNRLNMIGQVFLVFASLLMVLRIIAWTSGGGWAEVAFQWGFKKMPIFNYSWFVDLLFSGILGVGLYFHFSGRMWCRFACPLAALMNIYARFSQFRILANVKKCISCNVCTSVCHQGIDIMNFANKGLPMEDPECVRCSACVQSCPTGVLTFGRINRKTGETIATDRLAASPVQMAELTVLGQKI